MPDEFDPCRPLKRCIGASVYADFDGHRIVLTTENKHKPTNTIYMEPDVLKLFVEWVIWLRAVVDRADAAKAAAQRIEELEKSDE
jgi:hypothetical protein